jgi:hypothetical protein
LQLRYARATQQAEIFEDWRGNNFQKTSNSPRCALQNFPKREFASILKVGPLGSLFIPRSVVIFFDGVRFSKFPPLQRWFASHRTVERKLDRCQRIFLKTEFGAGQLVVYEVDSAYSS